jgi:hypothetical protein
MNAASVFEQEAIFDVFLRNHPHPKTVIFGVDHVYFEKNNYAKFIGAVKPGHFPEWMYDENPFNDWLPYNWQTMKITLKQFKCITGMRPFKYRVDGYEDFTKKMFSHDIDHIRKIIYGSKTPKEKKPLEPAVQATPELIKSFEFPAIKHLDRMLSRLPKTTRKIVIIPPVHVYHQPSPGSEDAVKLKEFKRRVADLVCRYQNAVFFDFMIESPITTRDENYFDNIHYTVGVANDIAQWIAQEAVSEADNPNFNRYCNRMTASFKR